MAKAKQRRPRIWGQYKGTLTFKQVEEGSNAAIRNAVRLLDDAKALLTLGRYPSAAFLAAIAIEEYGKLPILDLMASADPEEVASRWKDYRTHSVKNARWVLPALVDSGAESIDEISAAVNPNSWHQQFLDEIKQLWLYTDCLGGGEWSDPCAVASRETAEWMIGIACRLVTDKKVDEQDIANRAGYFKRMDLASTHEEKRRILAEYIQSEGKLSADTINSMLSSKGDS